jgi:hypothetical protein
MFEIRWNNGFWKLFNTHKYRDEKIFATQKEALEYLNA